MFSWNFSYFRLCPLPLVLLSLALSSWHKKIFVCWQNHLSVISSPEKRFGGFIPTVVWVSLAWSGSVLGWVRLSFGLGQPCLFRLSFPPVQDLGVQDRPAQDPQELLDLSHLHPAAAPPLVPKSPHANQHQPHEGGIKMPYERQSDGCRVQMRAGHPSISLLLLWGGQRSFIYITHGVPWLSILWSSSTAPWNLHLNLVKPFHHSIFWLSVQEIKTPYISITIALNDRRWWKSKV